jgi:acetyl-CoA carboxylase biotin carboxyl carrier protein
MAKLDLDLVRHALKTARENGIVDVQISIGDDSFAASLAPGKPKPKASGPSAAAVPTVSPDAIVDVKAPLVGYYRTSKIALEVGKRVEKGSAIAVVAALGIANDIEAPASGEIIEVLVQPDESVQYGQVLARIKP